MAMPESSIQVTSHSSLVIFPHIVCSLSANERRAGAGSCHKGRPDMVIHQTDRDSHALQVHTDHRKPDIESPVSLDLHHGDRVLE